MKSCCLASIKNYWVHAIYLSLWPQVKYRHASSLLLLKKILGVKRLNTVI